MKTIFTVFLLCVCFIIQVACVTVVCDHSAPCGCSKNDAIIQKIVGGETAVSSSWGWAISLRGSHGVDENNVLSPGLSIAVGMNLLAESATYDPSSNGNDIAILRLDRPLDLSISASTARLCIHRLNMASNVNMYPQNSSTLVAIGWGTLYFHANFIPDQLQQVTVNQVSSNADTCSITIHHPDLQFCAGVNSGGKDTCQGDSGGPLMHFESTQRRWMLAGITSYGKGCANPFYSGVYTRVAAYTNWLKSHIVNDGLVEVDVSDSGVKPTITTIITTPIRTISSTTQTATVTASFQMSNDSPLTITSYGFTFLFVLVTFHHHF
ncbi:unnamed protein product [Rotaria socialis]|uniref:Peptidase S1 domain-containing protein n=1 Tax=Rotaria socialis TaxID=392032 RepID=A0A820VTM7_9BILA|nr:unnamed protein product [Rotaria socialis]